MTTEKVKVLYIAGTMRSGSTILGRLLGELPGAVHVGELGQMTQISRYGTMRCECRKLVAECGFWQDVLGKAFGSSAEADIASFQATRNEYRLRCLPHLLLPRSAAQTRRLCAYLSALGTLYTAVRDISGASVVVDGSKDPLYAYLLSQVPAIDLCIVHLIRDSRAVAFSQQRVKKDPALFSNPGQLARFPAWETALQWNAVTTLIDTALHPSPLVLRYEDFAADPPAAVGRVWGLTGLPLPPQEFLWSPTLSLTHGHSASGNPDRFQSEVRLKPDLEWQAKMRPADRAVVTALTLPLLLRHGYLAPPHTKSIAAT